jgi:hypothetical protein
VDVNCDRDATKAPVSECGQKQGTNMGSPAIALGVICHVAVQNAVTSILVALLLSLIYYWKSYKKMLCIAIHEFIISVILHIFKMSYQLRNIEQCYLPWPNVICLGKWQITCTATKKATTWASCPTVSLSLEILRSCRY